MTTIVCVLKSGGDYRPAHVAKLQQAVKRYSPGSRFLCLTDIDGLDCPTVPLKYDWPGWWSKMELFRPDIRGALFYIDLDCVVVGDLSDLVAIRGPAIMRDVYRPDGLQSSIMAIPARAKKEIWQAFIADPQANMDACTVRWSKWGDQGFIEGFWLDKAKRFQDELPGQVLSYKADNVARTGVPEGARVIVFHGRPRPWEAGF